jgi:predicted nucleotidyltransferase
MFKREMDILQEMANDFSAYKGIIKAIAYGSRVRGDYIGDSDLDVLIIVDKKDKALKDKILDLVYSYELNNDLSFSITIFSLSEYKYNEQLGSPFMKNIKKEGIIFYDSGKRRKKNTFKVSS